VEGKSLKFRCGGVKAADLRRDLQGRRSQEHPVPPGVPVIGQAVGDLRGYRPADGVAGAAPAGVEDGGGGARCLADPAVAHLLPQADHRAEGPGPEPPDGRHEQDDGPPDRGEPRSENRPRQGPRTGEGRPRAARTGSGQPGDERPGRDAGRRDTPHRDRERGIGRGVLRPGKTSELFTDRFSTRSHAI